VGYNSRPVPALVLEMAFRVADALKTRRQLLSSLILATLVWSCAGCAAPSPDIGQTTPTPEYTTGDFDVHNVKADVEGDGPAEVTLTVDGLLPDVCTQIDSVSQERTGLLVSVHITTIREKGIVCAQIVATHEETIRLDTIPDPGVYTIQVNNSRTTVRIGQITEVPGAGETQTTDYSTPDGTLSLSVPSGWQVQTSPGSIVIAEAEGPAAPAETAPANRVSVAVITGPHRAADFGLDGLSQREVYATLVLTRSLMIPAPKSLEGAEWPTLWSHGSSAETGDIDLRVISVDAETMVAVLAQSAPGQWSTFEPAFRAMIATLQIH
jgi:hypothetical protein